MRKGSVSSVGCILALLHHWCEGVPRRCREHGDKSGIDMLRFQKFGRTHRKEFIDLGVGEHGPDRQIPANTIMDDPETEWGMPNLLLKSRRRTIY